MTAIANIQSQQRAENNQEVLVVDMIRTAVMRQEEAILALNDGEPRVAAVHLRRAQELFRQLLGALDVNAAPELGKNLESLYAWCIREMGRAEQTGDPRILSGTRRVSQSLLGAWEHVANTD